MDDERFEKCYQTLIEVARGRGIIPYSDLAKILGVPNQWSGWEQLLGRIYDAERKENRPDLTLVVVYKDTMMGRIGTPGNHRKAEAVAKEEYNALLEEVHNCWAKST